ncbi:MAG TPA: hypothetical protein DCP90_03685 [Clostridiales bacterium]|nr:hypothetical protein [Clostridiales bacterium]
MKVANFNTQFKILMFSFLCLIFLGLANTQTFASDDITIITNTTLTQNQTYNNVYLTGGVLNLNGNTLIVEGNLIQSAGTLIVSGGRLEVNGDYRIQTKNADESYSSSTGLLTMTNVNDYVLVNGNFVTQSAASHNGYLTNGVLEIKGNFEQKKYSTAASYNFYTTGYHKVILSGTGVQEISFEDYQNSYFNDLEITNLIANGVTFKTPIKGWTLKRDTIIPSDVELGYETFNLSGHRLTITGSLIQPAGTMYTNGGKLEVEGDYRIQSRVKNADGTYTYGNSAGLLSMTSSVSYVLVKGSFITQSTASHTGYLTNGVLEIKGNFEQKKYSTSASYNFASTGYHKVLLSGTGVQEVRFEDYYNSYFNDLEITNLTVGGVIFRTPIKGWTLKRNTIIPSDVELGYGTFSLSGYRLTINGSLIQSAGTMYTNGGRLEVEGDYRIQSRTKNVDGTYTYGNSAGLLSMTSSVSYVLVKGSFITQSTASHNGYLTNGALELRGNFEQKSGSQYNFKTTSNHVTFLNSDGVQNISFANPTISKFSKLVLSKPIETGYVFNYTPVWIILYYVTPGWMEEYPEDRAEAHYGETISSIMGVYAPTGNYSKSFTDINIPTNGFDLSLGRTYNSLDGETTSAFGRGWTLNFEGYLQSISENGQDYIEVKLPSGSKERFVDNGNDTYTATNTRNKLEKVTSNVYKLTTKDQTQIIFSNGYLSEIKDKNGNSLNINTDTTGKITSITDPAGRSISIIYNNGLIEQITAPESRTVTYTYQNGKLHTVTDPMGIVTTYEYDAEGYLNKIINNSNNIVEEITYKHTDTKNNHRVIKVNDNKGNEFTYTYDYIFGVTTITDINGYSTKEQYNCKYNTHVKTDAENKETKIEYFTDANGVDILGEVKSTTDRNGNKTEYEIDNEGNITKITNPDSSYKTYEYDNKNNITKQTDEIGNKTYYIYDQEQINLLKKVQPLNGTDTYIVGQNEESFAITTYEYYTETERQTLGYNFKALLKTETDPNGYVTTYTYDAYGNIQTITDPKSNTTTYVYDQVGLKTSQQTPKGNITTYTYNKNGNLEKQTIQSINNETTRITYDGLGRKTKEITPNQYNPSYDDLINHTYSADVGNRYTYYANGLLETSKDPENNITTYTYDIYGNIKTEEKPNGSIYENEYDTINRIKYIYYKETSTSSRQKLKEYIYTIQTDKTTKVEERTYFTSSIYKTETKIYDYAGREKQQTFADGSIKIIYNTNGTINNIEDKKGSKTYLKYDGLNRNTEVWTPVKLDGTTKYKYTKTTYDKAGNKTEESTGKTPVELYAQANAQDIITTTYTYYTDKKLKTVENNTGKKIAYEYDQDGNITKEEAYTSATDKNTTTYEHNHLNKVVTKTQQVIAKDIAGNALNDETTQELTTTYTYDKNGNTLTQTTPDNVTETYTYDNNNNRTSTSYQGLNETNNQATIVTTTTYNHEGKPVTATDPEGNTTTYTYTKQGFQETTTNAKNETRKNYYDLSGRLTAEVTAKNYDPTKTLTQMNRTEYTYDNMDRVTYKYDKYIDPETSQWVTITNSYQYDANGNKTKETDGLSYQTNYTYTLDNKVATELDPVNRDIGKTYLNKYEYDTLGRKTKETNVNGVITNYTYDDNGNLQQQTIQKTINDLAVTQATATYDYAGNKLTSTDSNSNVTTYQYNNLNQIRKITTPTDTSIPANTITNQYDSMGRLARTLDTAGQEKLSTYNHAGKVLTQTVQKTDQTETRIITNKYDLNGNLRNTTDPRGNTTQITYDELNRKTTESITVTDIDNVATTKTTTYTYDANGNQTIVTDWRENTTTTTYDPLNRKIKIIDPNNITIQKLKYNANHIQIESYDAQNNKTQYQYNKNNKLTKTIDPLLKEIVQTYDDLGNLKTKKDERNYTTTYNYDEQNRLIKVTNALNENTTYIYDTNGNLLTQTDGEARTTTYEYNAQNKVITTTDGAGLEETYTYNQNGLLATKTDRNGNQFTYTYNIHGQLTEEQAGTTTINHTYDNNGNILTATNTNGTTTYTYDQQNRPTTKAQTDIGTVTYKYDIQETNGKVSETITDQKGNETTNIYDNKGRLETVKNGTNVIATYTYNDNGNRASIVYPNGNKTTYEYNTNNKLTKLTNYKTESGSYVVMDEYTYTYDNHSNQLTKTEIIGGVSKGTTTYTYDELNRLKTITEPSGRTTAYTYDKSGNRKTETTVETVELQEQMVVQEEINVEPEIQELIVNETIENQDILETPIVEEPVVEDPTPTVEENPITTIETEIETETEETPVDEEIQTTPTEDNQAEEPVAIINDTPSEILSEIVINEMTTTSTAITTVKTYTYNNQNRLTQVETTIDGVATETVEYTYDNNGNQLTESNGTDTTTNTYDKLNQLIQTVKAGKTVQNMYNVGGNRISKTVDGATTNFLLDLDNNIILELDEDDEQTARNIHGINPISRQNGTNTVYYMYNGHADVTSLVDGDGTIQATYYYDEFGNIKDQTGTTSNPYRYGGYKYDDETGLYYLNARMYDPSTARFLQEDSYKGDRNDPLSLNIYTYCNNEPMMYYDPTGHWKEGDEKYSDTVISEIAIYSMMWENANAAYKLGIIDKFEKKSIQDYSERNANKARYDEDYPIKSGIEKATEFVVFDFILGDINGKPVDVGDFEDQSFDKMYSSDSYVTVMLMSKGFTGGNSKTMYQTDIKGKKVRIDIEKPSSKSSGNIHIHVGDKKTFLDTVDDIDKLPKSIKKNAGVNKWIKKSFEWFKKVK